jgi:hypothetical protein
MADFAKTLPATRLSWPLFSCLSFGTSLATGSQITTLRLSGRKGIAVYTSLVSPTIFIAVILIRLNRVSISIVTFTPSLRNRFSIMVLLTSFYIIRTNSVLDPNEYLTAITL